MCVTSRLQRVNQRESLLLIPKCTHLFCVTSRLRRAGGQGFPPVARGARFYCGGGSARREVGLTFCAAVVSTCPTACAAVCKSTPPLNLRWLLRVPAFSVCSKPESSAGLSGGCSPAGGQARPSLSQAGRRDSGSPSSLLAVTQGLPPEKTQPSVRPSRAGSMFPCRFIPPCGSFPSGGSSRCCALADFFQFLLRLHVCCLWPS